MQLRGFDNSLPDWMLLVGFGAMSFSMKLWEIAGEELREVPKSVLDKESRLEEWVRKDPSMLGMDLLLIGQQVILPNSGRIDLLALDREGNLVVLELKRDRTPREVVAQTLDYGSYVRRFGFDKIDELARKFCGKALGEAYGEHFGDTLPDSINQSHQLVILASELDESSERIVEYLAEVHEVPINVIFFTFFQADGREFLGRAWLMDPEDIQKRAHSRKQAPWSGYYFVNVGEGEHRNWDDCRNYGFIAAGHGPKYARAIRKLSPGDQIFAYIKGRGYVGFGRVTKEAVMARDFELPDSGRNLKEITLEEPGILHDADDPEMADWVVGIEWIKTFSRENAKTFNGVFANQNIVCQLRHPETVEFLNRQFIES